MKKIGQTSHVCANTFNNFHVFRKTIIKKDTRKFEIEHYWHNVIKVLRKNFD